MFSTELQRVVFSARNSYGAYDSYIRKTGGLCSENGSNFKFFANLEFNTLTFYNAFSVGKWKKYSCINSLFLRLTGSGEVIVQLVLAKLDNVSGENICPGWELDGQETTKTLLSQYRVNLGAQNFFDVEINEYEELHTGLLYFNIIPIEDGSLFYAGYHTKSPAQQSVRMALVITHFNRQDQLQITIKRLQEGFLLDDEFRDRSAVIVIDNSGNSGVISSDSVCVIDSDNYGGSGGFARGLLELEKIGHFTHCVFMDDDASCEMESLRRVYKLMMFAACQRMAVAGTLMHARSPNRIYEKGAIFDGLCRRIHPDLNISAEKGLIFAEDERTKPNYGGWWFFGFNLADVQYYPFPFFVRGDDTSFSLMNRFNIVTMNGIAAYGDTFESKNSVITTYLDCRSHLVQQMAILRHGRARTLLSLCRFFLKALLSLEYGSARAVNMAMCDISQGTSFFLKNIDMSSKIEALHQLAANQLKQDYDSVANDIDYFRTKDEFFLRKIARIFTINGALLPNWMLRERYIFQRRGFRAKFEEIYLYKRIYYAPSNYEDGYTVELNRKQMLACTLVFLKGLILFAFRYGSIRSDYTKNLPKIMCSDFWKKQYMKS